MRISTKKDQIRGAPNVCLAVWILMRLSVMQDTFMEITKPCRAVLRGAHLHCCPSRSCASRLWSLWIVSCWSAVAQTASAAGRGC